MGYPTLQKSESVNLLRQKLKDNIFLVVSVLLCLFILAEVNYPQLAPQTELALFAMLGLIVVFLRYPIHSRFADNRVFQTLDVALISSVIACFGYVVTQTEPIFQGFWLDGQSLGDRAGAEPLLDYIVGGIGLILVLEATRRSIGVTLPLLSLAFLLYAGFGQFMPDGLFPHRGYSVQRIVSQTFLHSQGTFGIALRVMFTYVFLFVLFGTLLERTGATSYVLDLARRVFGASAGAPAKVAVLSSGMMGSLSGSAVANTATTGTFTIPLMQRSGFQPAIAGGIEAAASSGGALVPPIMGAGAYMMLEIVEPAVTYLEIIRAALLPAILYYTGMLCMVHFAAKSSRHTPGTLQNSEEAVHDNQKEKRGKLFSLQGLIFLAAFVTLIGVLLMGATAFRAVSWSLLIVIAISLLGYLIRRIRGQHSTTETGVGASDLRQGVNFLISPCERAAQSGVSLIAAAACVGIILGVVTLTGIGSKLPSALLPLASTNLVLALFFLMISTIILGMGLPSSVCYLLMAILVGPVLLDLGVVPLAAHFFIFYFGMMSMVTPPVALAAYAASAIAGSGIMVTGFAAFRFALVGFALPYAFVLRPALLWLNSDGGTPELWTVFGNFSLTLVGTVLFAAAIAGYIFNRLSLWTRGVLFAAALILFFLPTVVQFVWIHGIVMVASIAIFYYNWREKETHYEKPS
ncbi:C4-dicarboxylate ABC transporter permease [Candidatus Poribacteria bacterium]|nr:MAG: C4-dicarboxylate ABC transporter permease [Candidatus Poribacteria bacterium]